MSGGNLYDSIKKLIDKVYGIHEISIDNFVFKLHRIGTVTILLMISALLSLSQVRFFKF